MARTPTFLLLSLIGTFGGTLGGTGVLHAQAPANPAAPAPAPGTPPPAANAPAPESSQAQGEYLLKNGKAYPASQVSSNGSAFVAKVPYRDTHMVFNFTIGEIERIDLPEPPEFSKARFLTASGKPADAVELLKKTLPPLEQLSKIPGSHWPRGIVLVMDAYGAMGKFPEAESEAKEATGSGLPDAQAAPIRDMLFLLTPTSTNNDSGLDAIKSLADDTTDPWLSARCWIEYGNQLMRRGRVENAVKAWLRAPVFHPAERDLAARGTILAARGLQQMDRANDGIQLLEQFLGDNLGSSYREVMQLEMAKLKPVEKKDNKNNTDDKSPLPR